MFVFALFCFVLFFTKDISSSLTKSHEKHEVPETLPKPKPKTGGGGGGLFDGDDEDDLFSGATSKPSPAAPVVSGTCMNPCVSIQILVSVIFEDIYSVFNCKLAIQLYIHGCTVGNVFYFIFLI